MDCSVTPMRRIAEFRRQSDPQKPMTTKDQIYQAFYDAENSLNALPTHGAESNVRCQLIYGAGGVQELCRSWTSALLLPIDSRNEAMHKLCRKLDLLKNATPDAWVSVRDSLEAAFMLIIQFLGEDRKLSFVRTGGETALPGA